MMSEREAILLFLYAFAVGAGISSFYDIFRILRIALYGRRRTESIRFRLPPDERSTAKALMLAQSQSFPSAAFFFTLVCDLVFCIVSAMIFTVLIFQFGQGVVRAFSLISALAGFVVCRLTIGRMLMLFADKIISFIKKIIKFILRFTLFPILGSITSICKWIERRAKIRREKRIARRKNRKKNKKSGNKNERGQCKNSDGGSEKAVSVGKRKASVRHRKRTSGSA